MSNTAQYIMKTKILSPIFSIFRWRSATLRFLFKSGDGSWILVGRIADFQLGGETDWVRLFRGFPAVYSAPRICRDHVQWLFDNCSLRLPRRTYRYALEICRLDTEGKAIHVKNRTTSCICTGEIGLGMRFLFQMQKTRSSYFEVLPINITVIEKKKSLDGSQTFKQHMAVDQQKSYDEFQNQAEKFENGTFI